MTSASGYRLKLSLTIMIYDTNYNEPINSKKEKGSDS